MIYIDPTSLGSTMDKSNLDNAWQQKDGERSRTSREYCKIVSMYGHDGTWGYTIFRAAYYPGSDDDFSAAISKIEEYVRWECYHLDEPHPGLEADQTPFEQLVLRFRNDVIEDTELESATMEQIAERFKVRVQSQGCDPGVYPRNRFCLVIDDEVLKAFAHLPGPDVVDRLQLNLGIKVIDIADENYSDDESDEDASDANEDEDPLPTWYWMWAAVNDLVELWCFLKSLSVEELSSEINGKRVLISSVPPHMA